MLRLCGSIFNTQTEKGDALNFHTMPVVDEGELVGIVGKEDVLRTLV
jgi:CBS domain-containing protein